MAVEESAILTAIANWIGVVGIPAVLGWNLRLVKWGHEQDLAIRDLEAQVKELQKTGTKIDDMNRTLQDVKGTVIQLKTLMDIRFGNDQDRRGRRAGDE